MGQGTMSEARWSMRRVSTGALGVPRRHVRTFSIQLGPHSISQGSLHSELICAVTCAVRALYFISVIVCVSVCRCVGVCAWCVCGVCVRACVRACVPCACFCVVCGFYQIAFIFSRVHDFMYHERVMSDSQTGRGCTERGCRVLGRA